MSTPVSAPPPASFDQRQLSPIKDEEEEHYSYDSGEGRQGVDRETGTPPFDADTKLANWTAGSANRRAADLGLGGKNAPPRAADAEGTPGGTVPPSSDAGQTARDAESPSAPPSRMAADELRTYQQAIREEHVF